MKPLVVGLMSGLILWWVWGTMDSEPRVRDEVAFVLQAEIFASGHWSVPADDHPEFFEQAHVVVTPVTASKYAPGHSLLLTLGVLFGLSGLVPILLTAISGGLLFCLAQRITDESGAWLTWFLWMNWEANIGLRASYFSELTTTAIWLAVWVLVVSWTKSSRRSLLVWTALLVGFSAITRPLTSLALVISLGVVILRKTWRDRQTGELVFPLVAGTAVLLLIPMWSYLTLGGFSETPLGLYTAQYIPWDRMGFGLDTTAPRRLLSPDLINSFEYFYPMHAAYRWSAIPLALTLRVLAVLFGVGPLWKWILIPFVIIGFVRGARSLPLLWWSVVGLFVAYLSYAHHPGWVLYYAEILPILCLFSALELRRSWGLLEQHWGAIRRHAMAVSGALWTVAIVATMVTMHDMRDAVAAKRQPVDRFRSIVENLPGGRVGVFVRYADDYKSGFSYQRNVADRTTAPIITVLDRGAENHLLVNAMPDRKWYRIVAPGFAVCRLAAQPLGPAVGGGITIPDCPPDS